MKIDQHVHSKISHDGISTMEEHMIYAKEIKIIVKYMVKKIQKIM